MAHIQWKDRFNINYKKIDDQHRKLVEILNDLIDLISKRSGPERVGPIFHRLFEYTQVHFTYEERFLRKARFVGGLAHKAEHASFVRKLLDLNQRYDASNPRLLEETLTFLQHWYLHHIMDMDMKYVPVMQGLLGKCEIQAIVFDANSVLLPFDLGRFGERVAKLAGADPRTVGDTLSRNLALLASYAKGELASAAFAEKISELAGTSLAERELAAAYAAAFVAADPVLALLPRLASACKLGLVASAGEWHSERVLENTPALAAFAAQSLSWRVGAVHPDPALLEDLLEKLDLIAEECVFVSADEGYLARAGEMLFHTLPFTGAGNLEEGLRRQGVKI